MNQELSKLSAYQERGRLLLRDANCDNYPEVSDSLAFSFSRNNFFRSCPNQLELMAHFGTAIISSNGFWKILQYNRNGERESGENKSVFRRFKILQIAIIDQSLITHVDMDGDEYYPEPHVYLNVPDSANWFAPFKYLCHANNELLDPAKRMW